MQQTSAIKFFSLEQVWFSPPSLSESVSVFLILTTCFFGGIMANFDINVYIIAHENLFHACKISRAPHDVRLISYKASRSPFGARPGIGRCYYIQTPAGAHTI